MATSVKANLSAALFGAVALIAQTLLLRRFLWRFEAAETGVALFLACWLLWSGAGAAAAATPWGRKATGRFSYGAGWLVAACAALYFVQYALVERVGAWLGIPSYQAFPLLHLALGCLIANAPFCFAAGFVVPSIGRWLERDGFPASRAFAWEALGAAAGGLALTALLVCGRVPDPRDVAEWQRCFPRSDVRPGRFETGGGTTFYGRQGGTFYAVSSSGCNEVIPEGDRSPEVAALVLSQRPYAQSVLLIGEVPLSVGFALEKMRPDLSLVWCPCDAAYGVALLRALPAELAPTRIRAAGCSPQALLSAEGEPAFDVALVMMPQATSLEGAAWRDALFLARLRKVVRRPGVALFGLECESAALTAEKRALLEITVRAIRQAWPESGVLAPGAGAWWVAAQVPGLAYEAEAAVKRFALLKRGDYPDEAVLRLYDPARARVLAQQCALLDVANELLLPDPPGVEETLRAGLADALRRAYPSLPGAWLAWARADAGARAAGLLLVVLWMAPVALGRRASARRRLLAAWLAACGALGLSASLAALYQLQMRFGALYILAGAGSCLYLAGLFCGNLCAHRLVSLRRVGAALPVALAVLFVAGQAGVALGILHLAGRMAAAAGLVGLCFAAGCSAGVAVPTAFALRDGARDSDVAVFVLADALGGAAGGLFFALALVPLAGIASAVLCFAALAFGITLGVAAGRGQERLLAGLAAGVSALALLLMLRSGAAPEGVPPGREAAAETAHAPAVPQASATNAAEAAEGPRGVQRRIAEPRLRELMRQGRLSTREAEYWDKE